ncbi:MAG: ribose-phosphate pyrophosphokinase [Candidatus Eisenbacteria bacterium]|nr:ribose-phosphate pyrophosphokinase [Candidatus Eisenbacteria bacterium]
MVDSLRLFSGNANRALAERMAAYAGVPLGKLQVSRFSDGEINVQIQEDIRGCDVFIIQPTFAPAENLMELLIMVDASRRASADRVTAVIPYFGYARQDRKDKPRAPISAKLVANLITIAGADRVLTMDLHSPQIQGFFDIPFDHLYASPVLARHFRELAIPNLVVAAPDVGAVKMARGYAKRLNASLVVVNKRRATPDSSEVTEIIGEVEGRNVLLIDDLISTAGTIKNASLALKERGALGIYAGCTHPCFSGPAIENLKAARLEELVVTDTIPVASTELGDGLRVLSAGDLFGEAVVRIHEERSLSGLFD